MSPAEKENGDGLTQRKSVEKERPILLPYKSI